MNTKNITNNAYMKIIGIVFILKMILYLTVYHGGDLLYRAVWVTMLQGHDLGDAYFQFENIRSISLSIDYPPFYIYYLWILSLIKEIFNPEIIYHIGLSYPEMWLMKLPAFIFEIITFMFLYKNINKEVALTWLILPLNIIQGCMFGDSEMVLGFFVIATLTYIYKEKYVYSGLTLALALCIKPQAMYLCACCIIILILTKVDIKTKIKTVIISLLTFYIMWIPFIIERKDLIFPFRYFIGISNRWNYFSKRAPNISAIYAVIRANTKYPGITAIDTVINYILIATIILLGAILLYKTKNILLSVGTIWISIYYITFYQHCRYIYYPIILLLYASYKLKNKHKELYDTVFIIHLVSCIHITSGALVEDIASFEVLYSITYLLCTLMHAILYILFISYIIKNFILNKSIQ